MDALRNQLLELLDGRAAHATFDDAVEGIPVASAGRRPDGLPYSLWQLVEHLRIAQHDILDFCRNPDYEMPDWPAAYWPDADAPPDSAAWAESLAAFRADLQAMKALVADPNTDLHAEIPHGSGQTVLREALVLADHNAYHIGQIVVVRRRLGIWD